MRASLVWVYVESNPGPLAPESCTSLHIITIIFSFPFSRTRPGVSKCSSQISGRKVYSQKYVLRFRENRKIKCLSLSLYVCLSVYLSITISFVRPSVCPSVHLSVYLSISIYLFQKICSQIPGKTVKLSVSLYLCTSVCLSIYLSVYQFISLLFVHPSVHLSVYLSISIYLFPKICSQIPGKP
jgi:hypothetical protein